MKSRRKSRNKSDERERGEMDYDITQNINGVDEMNIIEIVVD